MNENDHDGSARDDPTLPPRQVAVDAKVNAIIVRGPREGVEAIQEII